MSGEELTKAEGLPNPNEVESNDPTEIKDDALKEVEDDNLTGVSGGIIFKTPKSLKSYDPKHPWEVLDDKSGKTIQKFSSKENAEEYCARNGLSEKRIWTMGTVEEARANWEDHINSGGDPNKFKNKAWGRI